ARIDDDMFTKKRKKNSTQIHMPGGSTSVNDPAAVSPSCAYTNSLLSDSIFPQRNGLYVLLFPLLHLLFLILSSGRDFTLRSLCSTLRATIEPDAPVGAHIPLNKGSIRPKAPIEHVRSDVALGVLERAVAPST